MRRLFILIFVSVFAVFVHSCVEPGDFLVDDVGGDFVLITNSLVLAPELPDTIQYRCSDGMPLQFKSSNEKVVKVDSVGILKAISQGSATIEITCAAKTMGKIPVTVPKNGVTVDGTTYTVTTAARRRHNGSAIGDQYIAYYLSLDKNFRFGDSLPRQDSMPEVYTIFSIFDNGNIEGYFVTKDFYTKTSYKPSQVFCKQDTTQLTLFCHDLIATVYYKGKIHRYYETDDKYMEELEKSPEEDEEK